MVDRTLSALLSETPAVSRSGGAPGAPIAAVTQDSRDVQPGSCFVALPGFHVDGHEFLHEAQRAGATALVVQSDRRERWQDLLDAPGVALIEVADTRVALASLSAAYHGFPARQLTVVGVTGTDGKSTTCYLTSSILEAAGHRTGMIGGVQFKIADDWRMNTITQTSPEAPLVQSLLAEMVAAGVTHAVVESTSHGLALHRLDHCEYDVGVFTGLSDDHLDFHGTREAYLAAKLRLFQELDASIDKGLDSGLGSGTAKRAVFHAADPHADAIRAATSASPVTVGFEGESVDISTSDVSLRADGSSFRLATPGGALGVDLRLPGRFNVHNALLAAGAGWALGCSAIAICDGLSALPGVPGRMERIDAGQPFTVLVDAAATTDALRVVLQSLKPLVEGRLIVVFGCAGERDSARRAGMGAVAAQSADYTVLTSENPRSEQPAAIVDEIAAAMLAAGATSGRDFEQEPDRRAAIARAFALAAPGDLVLIAGKGAEQSIIIGDTVLPWDDRTVARELLAAD